MAHFARVDKDNIVTQVIVVDNTNCLDERGDESEAVGIKFCQDLLGGEWVQTSFNGNFRKSFAGIGLMYDPTLDAFRAIRPYASWLLNEDTCIWEPPVPFPEDVTYDEFGHPNKSYTWEEPTTSWV
jgi:hypothetical protein